MALFIIVWVILIFFNRCYNNRHYYNNYISILNVQQELKLLYAVYLLVNILCLETIPSIFTFSHQ